MKTISGTLPVNADQYASQLSNPFTKHGLPVPGAYFQARENQQAATVAISKSGQGVGEAKQPVSKVDQKPTHHVRSATKGS
jgi:hypothetical protein